MDNEAKLATQFVRIQGTKFVVNGRPYPVVGGNCYYLGYCPLERPQMVESVLDAADGFSLNVLRIWAFLDVESDGAEPPLGMFGTCYQYFDTVQNRILQVGGDRGLRRLDRAVHLVASRGYKLILVLTNSPPEFGGMDSYLRWLSNPSDTLRHDEFYEREDVCTAYESWVAHVLERTNTENARKYKDNRRSLPGSWPMSPDVGHKGVCRHVLAVRDRDKSCSGSNE